LYHESVRGQKAPGIISFQWQMALDPGNEIFTTHLGGEFQAALVIKMNVRNIIMM